MILKSPNVLTVRLTEPEHFPQHVLKLKLSQAEQGHIVKGDGAALDLGNSDTLCINE